MSINVKHITNISLKYLLTSALVPFVVFATEHNFSGDILTGKTYSSYVDVSSSSSYTKKFCQLYDRLLAANTEELPVCIENIRTFAKNHIENPNSFDLMEIIHMGYNPIWERLNDLGFYRTIANTPNHTKRCNALYVLWNSDDPGDNTYAYSSLKNLAQEDGPLGDQAALLLLLFLPLHKFEFSNKIQNRILKIAKDTDNPQYKQAVTKIWQFGSEENKKNVRKNMFSVVQKLKHEHQGNIDKNIKNYFLAECCAEDASDMEFIRSLAATLDHPLSVDSLLWLCEHDASQHQTHINQLHRILINYPDHPSAHKSAEYVLKASNSYEQGGLALTFLRDALKQDQDISRAYEISKILYEKGKAEDLEKAHTALIQIAQNTDPNYIDIAEKCAKYLYYDKDGKPVGRAVLRQIAERRGSIDMNNAAYNAIITLFYSGCDPFVPNEPDNDDLIEDYNFAKTRLYEIIKNPFHHYFECAVYYASTGNCNDLEKQHLILLLRKSIEKKHKICSSLLRINLLSDLLKIGDESSVEFAKAELVKSANKEDYPDALDASIELLRSDVKNNIFRELFLKNFQTASLSKQQSVALSYDNIFDFLRDSLSLKNAEDNIFFNQALEYLYGFGQGRFFMSNLLYSEDKDVANFAFNNFCAIAQNPNHKDFYYAAKILQEKLSYHTSDQLPHAEQGKTIAHRALLDIAENPKHKNFFDALSYLWSNNENEEDIAIVRPKLISIAENLDHINCDIAASNLSGSIDKEDKKLAMALLNAIMQSPNHPNKFISAFDLWNSAINEVTYGVAPESDQRTFYIEETNIVKLESYQEIFPYEEYIKLARSTLLNLMENINHKNAFYIGDKLWNFASYPMTEVELFSRTASFAYMEEGKTIGNQIIRAIASTPNHNDQKNAIRKLRESNNPDDQRMGRELQNRYFPAVWKPETIKRMAKFNNHAIRATMPQPLADLSAEPMDIVSEFDELIKRISIHEKRIDCIPADPIVALEKTKKFSVYTLKTNPSKFITVNNPYYLSPRAIDGDSTITENASLEAKKDFLTKTGKHAIGFLKTLTGQELLPDETSGWQMYDDNKADMINSLKHLVNAIKQQFELGGDTIQNGMVGLGIILNGILHCPTGQAEGIESAVNILVHGNNVISTESRAFFGKHIIAAAMQKAFNTAFHHGGGVHELARARTALKYLGFSYAIDSFEERISRIDDEEIPNYYNAFYRVFTPAYIIAEARRNIQTPDESSLIESVSMGQKEPSKKQTAKAIKMNKPINVGQIVQYLVDKNEQGALHDRFGISQDFKSITDEGLLHLLVKMGYLNDSAMN